jgi:hypothetical protein
LGGIADHFQPAKDVLPPIEEIVSVEAIFYQTEVDMGLPSITPVTIPAHRMPSILERLMPCRQVSDPPIRVHDPLGKMKLTLKDGQRLFVTFYWSGQNPVVFTVDGRTFYWGNPLSSEGNPALDGGLRLVNDILDALESRPTN